jgi:Tol biopolymer transport system component/DNA-binding winged helix-turn-helix (wHTH) protein
MAEGIQTKHLYRFGPFCLDAAERLLLRDGRSVALPPKIFETLLVLVENHGRILEKEELIRILWPDSFVEESSLSQNIFQLRKALGESSSGQQYIETIPRRGYRFVADVIEARAPQAEILTDEFRALSHEMEVTAGVGEAEAPNPTVADQAELTIHPASLQDTARGSWKKFVAAALLITIAAAAFGVYRLFTQRHAATASAVPFHTMRMARLTRNGKVRLQTVSPDGKYVAHVLDEAGQQSLWIRQTATTSNVQIVPPAEMDYLGLAFSRDGNYIFYSVYPTRPNNLGLLFQLPVLGGAAKKLIEDVDSAIAVSPDGKQVAFVRNYPLQWETSLVVVSRDGSGERKLVTRKRPNHFSYAGPSWSPDGKIIALAARQYTPTGSYMNVVGVRVEDGVETPIGAQQWTWVGQVAWMNDNSGIVAVAWHPNYTVFADQIWHLAWPHGETRRITNDLDGYSGVSIADDASALTTIQSTRMANIWIVPRDRNGQAVQITSGFGDNYSEMLGMAWLPDGRIVYGSNAGGNTDLWIMNSDGRDQRQLTTEGSSDTLPSVSADGRWIVYSSYSAGVPHVWRMDSAGANVKQLTNGDGEYQGTLSPDGKWLIYLARKDNSRRVIWKMPLEGGEPVALTDDESGSPVVSPDGKWIGCFLLDRPAKMKRLAIIPFGGGQPVFICKGTMTPDYGLIQWTPDSRALTFIYTRNGVSNIQAQPINGGASRPLTDFRSDRIYRFAWSPDGKYLACERGATINDIVLVTHFASPPSGP